MPCRPWQQIAAAPLPEVNIIKRLSLQRWRHNKQAERAAKTRDRYQQAPQRIRKTARWCYGFGVLAVLGGVFNNAGTPTFGGEAYTEIVARLAQVYGAVAWLAAVVLFATGVLLKALADILDEMRRDERPDR